jgi:phage-related protein
MADLRLQVILTALDKVTGPLKKIRDATNPTAKALKATSDRLKELNAQQKSLNQFRALRQGLDTTTKTFNEAQSNVNRLAKELRGTETPTRAMTREFNAAVKAAKSLKTEASQQGQQLQVLRDRLSGAGISTTELGKAQSWLKNSIGYANAELTSQQGKLTAIAAQQQRVANAKLHADKLRGAAGNVAIAGAGAMVAGRVMATPSLAGLSEAKHYQTENARVMSLGLGEETSQQAEAFARNMKTYGTSKLDNLELVRDSMSIFGDLHHAEMVAPTLAKMKFGNKAFYGEEKGEDNERKFMDMLKVIEIRGGLASPKKFHEQANMVQKVITATGGRVGPTEWLNMIKTGGVAAKGMDDAAFYYQMEPLVQEMGGHRVGTSMMSAYNNLYQGRTTKRAAANLGKLGLIGDYTKVKFDKVGQTAQLDPGALLGSDLFKKSQFEWMETILLPQLAKHGITEKSQILDTIGGIFSNRTASDLHANMYLQSAQIHKNEKLNAGAFDIEQINALGQKQASGQELETLSKLADLKLAMGEKIIPIYIEALGTLTDSIKRLNVFMQENPALGKAMIVGFSALAAILVVIGPLMLGLAALMGPYAMLTVIFTKLGIGGGVLMPILRGIGTAVLWLGRIFLVAGRALLMNPIGLIITAIAVAAMLIYTYWEPIKTFFIDLWSGACKVFEAAKSAIGSTMSDLWDNIKTGFFAVMQWFAGLPTAFSEFGSNMMRGLVDGITNALGWVKDKIVGAGSTVMGWLKEQFNLSSLSKTAAQLGAGVAIGSAMVPAATFAAKPPLLSPKVAAAPIVQGDNIQIAITPSPGMDEAAVGRAVQQAMEQRDYQKRARLRSNLSDY